MPENEVGDRVHNFFEQGNLSQDQRHNQVPEGNWPVFNNNLWGGNGRQIGAPLNPSSKNYNVQQSDVERGQGNQFSLSPHGLNFPQSNLRSEFVKHPTQLQQLNLGGFVHSSQAVHTRQNETNFLGVDTEPDRHNLTSRGFSILESQQRSGVQHINSASFGGSEFPMNFNFLGGQQQMSGQQQRMLQSVPRQQSAISDAQLLQQQVILKQMQEIQRQNQQLQQFEAMQRNAVSQISNFPNQMAGQHSPAINGNPFHEASNYPWQSQVMTGNTNWPESGLSAVQGYSNGVMITPEQGQALRFMGLIPQQASQSLYGVPVSNSRTANPLSYNNTDKPGGLQLSTPASSISGNQYALLMEKAGMQDASAVSRSGSEGKTAFEHASGESFRNVVNPESFNQVQQRSLPLSEGGREDSAGGSELLPEKSVTQTTSQAAVALDPTEEKILFGSDENIWEAFGGTSLTGSGGGSRLDSADPFGAFPCVQSGTWSALMQSAVAETSSSDVRMQEEWSGLGSQNSRAQSGNQHPSTLHENEKPPVWVDSSQRASFGPRAAANDVITTNYLNSLPQPSPKQATEVLQTESQMPQEGMKWLDRNQPKPHAEQNRALENATSKDCSKTNTVFWSHQQSTFSHDNSGKPSISALNFIESVPANGGIASSNQDDFHDQEQNRRLCMDAGHGSAIRFESIPTSNIKMGSPQVDTMDEAITRGLSTTNGNSESGQKLPDNNHIDLWKSVNSSAKSGNLRSGHEQHNLNNGPPILESSVVVSGEGASEMREAENGDKVENSSDSHRSNIPYHAAAGGLRETLWSDAGDRSSLPVGKDKSSDQAGRKALVTRKFQYHPMGDVDMDLESSYGSKQVSHPQAMVHRGQETRPQFHGPLSSDCTDVEKGHGSDVRGAIKVSHGISSSGIQPAHFPNTASFVRSGEISSSNQHASSSQNMLELLHKVDQSMESNMVSAGPVGLSQSQPSTSHGFSLQLAPPSQRVTPSNLHFASQISSRPIDSPSSDHMTPDKGDRTHAWLTAVPSQMRPGNNRSGIMGTMEADGSTQNQRGRLLAPLSAGSSYLRNSQQNQHMTAAGGKMASDQSSAPSFDSHAHHDHQNSNSQDQAAASRSISNSHDKGASGRYTNQSGMRAFMHQVPPSPPAVRPGMSGMDNQWPSRQQLWGAQAHNASDLRYSQFPPNGTSETSSLTRHEEDDQDGPRISSPQIVDGNEAQVVEGLSSGKTADVSQEEPLMRHPSDASSNATANRKDHDGFHHSSKPNTATLHNYSLLHQMQAMKNRVADPSQRESKRLKGLDNGADTQAAQPLSSDVNNVVCDASVSQTSISFEDMKKPNFSPESGNRNASFQFAHGTNVSQDMFSFARSESQKLSASSSISSGEYAGISPQMAPSWFEHYGSFKNGQLLTAHNVPRIPVTKNMEQLFIGRKSPNNLVIHSPPPHPNAVVDTVLIGNSCQATSSYTSADHDSDGLAPHVSMPTLASLGPKKRKTATSDLLPWNIEIGQGFKRLQNISSAEIDWAQSSNRLVEKVEHETDPGEDLLPMGRQKRRLILTTQLMQQVFRPPSSAVLSLDASSHYEVIVFSLARLVLGDACSLVCCTEDDLPIHLRGGNTRSEKVRAPERIRDQYFSKVIEDLSDRAKELEHDLMRLDKRASILDFRLDCQDLERFSVINRFARFHGRGQVDGAETSSSSDAGVIAQRPCPQRYVSAHPMPSTVPERVQCLSL